MKKLWKIVTIFGYAKIDKMKEKAGNSILLKNIP